MIKKAYQKTVIKKIKDNIFVGTLHSPLYGIIISTVSEEETIFYTGVRTEEDAEHTEIWNVLISRGKQVAAII